VVLLGVPDGQLPHHLGLAAARGDAGAVVFGSAGGQADALVAAAADLVVCGAGCMGFVNPAHGVRALGYLERHPLPVGPIALVTHSGSAFSALLRTHRRLEYCLAVSSGQELVTTTADYLAYALEQPQTGVIALLVETIRDAAGLARSLDTAAERGIPVVALTLGRSAAGRRLVDAHSGALAGSDAAWEALFSAYGVHRVADLAELADSLEVFAVGRRLRRGTQRGGIATVHDSGAERVLVADLADQHGVPFAPLAPSTTARLEAHLDPGLAATNPLDVWGRGAETEQLFTECMLALADDPAVDVVVLAVDLVPELDGDDSFPRAVRKVTSRTDKPVVVLTNLASAVDQQAAWSLRAAGIPVLEGTGSGLKALGHLLADAAVRHVSRVEDDPGRRRHWRRRLAEVAHEVDPFVLLAAYGLEVVQTAPASSAGEAARAAARLGFPVVLKTAASGVSHKLDVGGVRLGLQTPEAVRTAYVELATTLGPEVVVQPQVPPGVELALGVVRDPLVGPLVVVGAGGALVELLGQRAVALPPVDEHQAARLVQQLPVARLLDGYRGSPPADTSAAWRAITAVSRLAADVGDLIEALDVNPLIVGRDAAVAVDALLVPATDGPAGLDSR
jgi:acyl-CoA synthetase (NDP forming)